MSRLLTAAVGIPILFLVIKKGPLWACFALVAVCGALATREACVLLETPIRRPLKALAMAGSVAVSAPFLLRSSTEVAPGILFTLPLVATLGAVLLGAVSLRASPAEMVETSLATLFPVLFVGLPLGFLTALRATADEEMGRDLLVLLLVVVWVGDTAAYYVGSLIGRRRLAPHISPKKTLEGAIAGIAGCVGGAILAHFWWFRRLPVTHAIAIGLLLGIIAIAGDLAESVFKRAAGTKDSSSILPGHGGLLDRIDSLLFAGPALYYYYVALLLKAAHTG